MKNKKMLIALGAVCLVNFIAHLCFYPALPDTVPTHWGFDGQVDGWGPKYMVLVTALIPAAILLLIAVVPKIDPKSENFQKFGGIYRGFLAGIVLFLCGISWLSELTVYNVLPDGSSLVGVLVSGGIGILFILLGNYMPRIKQNYTFGCRTPWALADEHNWNRTQRMGGITFVVMGVVLLFLGLFAKALGEGLTLGVLLVVVLGGSLWIYVYSFLVFKKIMR